MTKKRNNYSNYSIGQKVIIRHSHDVFIKNDIVTVIDNKKVKVDGKHANLVEKANGVRGKAKLKYMKSIK